MDHKFLELLESSPVIAAVKDRDGLWQSIRSECSMIFILFGDILTIAGLVEEVKNSGKLAMVHIDLIGGLSAKDISVDFIKQNTRADGILSTKPLLIKRGRDLGLFTVLRFFVIDSMAYSNIITQCAGIHPDCIEILPGIIPKVIRHLKTTVKVPIIAGGLINDKEDIVDALKAGAVSVSSSNQAVWSM